MTAREHLVATPTSLARARRPATAGPTPLQAMADGGPQALRLGHLQAAADRSPQVVQAKALDQAAHSVRGPFPLQRAAPEEEEPLQARTLQRAAPDEEGLLQARTLQRAAEEEEPLQARAIQHEPDAAAQPNRTGMPDTLKSGIEALSGIDMSDVRVRTNSSKPAQLNALAYAQGEEIHVAPGQEQHLPHEAWHIAQQRQGRVQPTGAVAGQPVNDDAALEQEADRMGAAAQRAARSSAPPLQARTAPGARVIQAVYEIRHPETKQMVDLDHPSWTVAALGSLMSKLEPAELAKHKAKFTEVMQRATERESGARPGPAYPAPTPSSSASSTSAMSASDQTILDGVHLKERASKASNYTMNPSEIAELATSGETEPLLPDSAPLARHKVAEVKKLAFTAGGGMGAGKVAEFGASALGETLGPVASGVGGGINALHTGSQAARLAALDGGDHETGGAIDQLTANRGKKAATQVGKTAAAATTGFFTGAAVGTAIPVPILGTVVGALVGGLVGFAAGKAVEIFGDKALQDPIDDYHAVLKLHTAVLAGNAAALEAFEFLGVDKATAQAPDGWKALVAKVGASPS